MLKSGVSMFFTDYSMAPGALGTALEQRGFEFALGARTFAHSAVAANRLSPAAATCRSATTTPWIRS